MNPMSVLRDAWFFFSNNLASIARLCLPLLLVEVLCQYLLASQLGEQANPAYSILLGLAFYPLYAAPLILFLNARSQGIEASPVQLFEATLRLWPGFALLAGLSTLVITLGLSLLILPGIWIMVRLSFAEVLLVLQQLQPLHALKASFDLTRGRFLPVFACLAGVLVPALLLDAWTEPSRNDALLWVLQQSASGFIQLLATVVIYRLYMLIEPRPNPEG